MKKRYVAGFLFSADGAWVALVHKQKPAWQKNKWNAIGGKIEDNESALQAMQREFREETGVDIAEWNLFCSLVGNDADYMETGGSYEVHFFSHFSDKILDVRTMETELIDRFHVAVVHSELETIPNLRWLIPLALERGLIAKVFDGIS